MVWKIYLITIGVIAIAAAIPIVVLAIKLRSASRDADRQWNRAERAVRDHETTLDEISRMRAQVMIEEMDDAEILTGLRDDLAEWSPRDSPRTVDDTDTGAGA